MSLAEIVDWLSVQSVWLRGAIACPLMMLFSVATAFGIGALAHREE